MVTTPFFVLFRLRSKLLLALWTQSLFNSLISLAPALLHADLRMVFLFELHDLENFVCFGPEIWTFEYSLHSLIVYQLALLYFHGNGFHLLDQVPKAVLLACPYDQRQVYFLFLHLFLQLLGKINKRKLRVFEVSRPFELFKM